MPEASSKPVTKLPVRPQDQVSVLIFTVTFTLRPLLTCFHFWKIQFTLKAKPFGTELRADARDSQRNDQKKVLCPWLPSLLVPPSQDSGTATRVLRKRRTTSMHSFSLKPLPLMFNFHFYLYIFTDSLE